MDWVLGRVVDQSHCGASASNTEITNYVFVDDAVIFAESLEVLVMALEALHEEVMPLELQVSWPKTKIQIFFFYAREEAGQGQQKMMLLKEMPTAMFYIYRHVLIKPSKNLYTSSQKKNVTFVKNIVQSYRVHNGVNTHSQCYISRKCILIQKDFLQIQKQGVNQICHYHCAVSSRNPAHGDCLKQLASPRNKNLFAIPQRHMSLAWLDSLAVTQAGWFRALGQSRLVENLMEGLQAIHDYSHLSWWGSIILSTILMRSILTFPLAVYQKYIMAKVENLRPEMNEMIQELKKETAYAVKKYGWNERHARYMFNRSAKKMWRELIIRDNCHPFKASAVLWVQLPLWISISVSLRNMSSMMPHQDTAAQVLFMQLSTGGFGWIPNLTDVDHSLILPVLMGLTNLLIIECVALYWVTSSVCGLLQNLVLMHPGFHRALRLPPVVSQSQQPYHHLWLQLLKKMSKKGSAQE
ncbi:cytochrome c oxidase assembly protein COX18, mitochondrial-like isoform X2 [Portunus trituberculatus]|uniref:cytochrome c oxidase assembly protein COX18, mitochondrial-like isoform X2 n=1 Tax=Portunus trituberculatus TaxID=210409 RepID=UPI001E1CD3D8|nr:cytochrome c oxidase assembly protein COX18, mitochondrial-like isoform X2 [Portunus trituberculatus]